MAKMVIDKKTGKKRAVNLKASKAATKGAKKRKKKTHSPATIAKIKKGVRLARKTGKTKAGRKTKWKKSKGGKVQGASTKKSSAKAKMSAGGKKGGKK